MSYDAVDEESASDNFEMISVPGSTAASPPPEPDDGPALDGKEVVATLGVFSFSSQLSPLKRTALLRPDTEPDGKEDAENIEANAEAEEVAVKGETGEEEDEGSEKEDAKGDEKGASEDSEEKPAAQSTLEDKDAVGISEASEASDLDKMQTLVKTYEAQLLQKGAELTRAKEQVAKLTEQNKKILESRKETELATAALAQKDTEAKTTEKDLLKKIQALQEKEEQFRITALAKNDQITTLTEEHQAKIKEILEEAAVIQKENMTKNELMKKARTAIKERDARLKTVTEENAQLAEALKTARAESKAKLAELTEEGMRFQRKYLDEQQISKKLRVTLKDRTAQLRELLPDGEDGAEDLSAPASPSSTSSAPSAGWGFGGMKQMVLKVSELGEELKVMAGQLIEDEDHPAPHPAQRAEAPAASTGSSSS